MRKKLVYFMIIVSILAASGSIISLNQIDPFSVENIPNSEKSNHSTKSDDPNDIFPCSTFEEWRNYLLERNNMSIEDLDDLNPKILDSLNQQARIYQGWSNGTYTDAEKDQLLEELHSTPEVLLPVLLYNSEQYFRATFDVENYVFGEHVFRVYAYLDYDRSDTNINGGNRFYDGDTEKDYGPYWDWERKDPWSSDLNPKENFMGSHRDKILNVNEQQPLPTRVYEAEADPDKAGPIYFVIQILWRYDTYPAPLVYEGHHKWLTKFYSWQINDDDINPPIIPEESDYNPWFYPIVMPSIIYDSMSSFTIKVAAYDTESGLDNKITFGGVDIPNGVYLDKEAITFSWEMGYVYAYWYRYTIPNIYTLGEHTVELKVWDADKDWVGDQLSTSRTIHFWVYDDDVSPPWINWMYTGDYTDGNPGGIEVTAGDDSGLLIDPSGVYIVPNSLGTYVWNFLARDNDNDRPNDQLENEVDVTIQISDDDVIPPILSDLIIKDDFNEINISFTAIDMVTGDDEGIGKIKIYIDDELVSTYNSFNPSDIYFDFTVENEWYMEYGSHEVKIEVWDADNDRPEEAEVNTIGGTFETTLEDMCCYIIEIDLINLIDFIEAEIDSDDKEKLINYITYATYSVKKALVGIICDAAKVDIDSLLSGAQWDLGRAKEQVGGLLNKRIISQELADILLSRINQAISDIEIVRSFLTLPQ